MEHMKVNKKNKKPVICRTSIDILENKIKDLLWERETNLKMVETAEEKNLSIIKSQKEIIVALGEEIEKLKEEYKKDIRQGQLWKSREKQKKENDVLKQEIEKLKEQLDYEGAKAREHSKFLSEMSKIDKQEIEKLKEENKLVNQNAEMLLQEMVASDKKEVNEVITDKLNEDIEDIIKSKEEGDKKHFDIRLLEERLERSKQRESDYIDECERLKEENITLKTAIRESGILKLQTKIKQLNEEITCLRNLKGLETFN